MAIELNPIEIRVLGVLIEKAMTVPQSYPMTLNGITVGCNQKNNRHPVLTLPEGDVAAAVHSLQQWQLASIAPPEPGSRSNKFRHDVEKRLGWTTPQKAIMGELMIRGPQTVGELRTNASRMTRMDAIDYVREVLSELERMDPPMVRELARQPGQSATRFAQLLGGPVEDNVPSHSHSAATTAHAAPAASRLDQLEAEVASLKAELSSLRDQLRSAGLLP
jgi:uncharacterized protein